MAESAAQKRVTALTGYLVAVLAVAASLGLYRLDAESYREDAQALLRLQRLSNWLATVDADSLDLPARAAGREAVTFDLMAVGSPFLASAGTPGLADKDTVARLLEQLDALYAPTTLNVARGH